MEKNPPEKSVSFTGRNGFRKNDTSSPRTSTLTTVDERSDSHETKDIFGRENVDDDDDECFSDHDHNLDQVSEDVDRFTDTLSAVDDKSNPPEVPDAVETFSKIVESRISKYSTCEPPAKFGKMTEEDSFFFEAVRRLSKLTNAFSEFPTTSSLNRTTMVLQRAMSFMEEEFRALLEDSRTSSSNSNTKVLSSKQHSFSSKVDDYDRCILPDPPESTGDDDFPAYSPDVVIKMNRIASAMISAGYETECCQVYSISRRNAFNEALKKLEFEKISIDDVQRMQWESLEGQITTWIKVVKQCATVLFPGERRLCESVFSHHNSISRSLFSNLARATIIQFLNFAEAVALTKRSAEKLFKFLDMNETLHDLIPAIDESCSDDSSHELKFEISAAADRIGEAAVNIYSDLENSIKSDAGKTPVPGGAIHPLTRYVMNYLKYSCEYKDTLEQIFQQNKKIEQQRTLSITTKSNGPENEIENQTNNQRVENSSPFSIQLITIMDLLDANLEAKSKLYKDLSLRYIFLMNNGRYILQKIKGSTEIYQSMGDTWCRKRSTELRHYHKSYQRETWGKVLQCLRHEGLLVNGKVIKPVLKERFKNFNTLFDEIHKTQGTWVVSDEQLQSELRVSVSAVVTPAYRSFLGRFRQYLEGKQSEKYIKYQSEDIETLIEELFDGNPTSMGRRRT